MLHVDVCIRSAHHAVMASILVLSKLRALAKYSALTLTNQHSLWVTKIRRVCLMDLLALITLVSLALEVLWGRGLWRMIWFRQVVIVSTLTLLTLTLWIEWLVRVHIAMLISNLLTHLVAELTLALEIRVMLLLSLRNVLLVEASTLNLRILRKILWCGYVRTLSLLALSMRTETHWLA